MALDGNLKDFSLEHIFQLAHSGNKTGTLHIVRGNGEAEAFVYFRNGKIFGAVSNFNRVPIGERLISAGYITEENLEQALRTQKQDKKRRKIGQILVSEGIISPEILKKIVREQIQSTVFDLLPWEEGEFQFLPNLPSIEDIGLLVNAKKVLLESNQRRSEWDRVRQNVPSNNAVFALNDSIPTYQNDSLTPEHWRLLRHINGQRTVTNLASINKTSEFETSSLLSDLIDAGLLKLLAEKPSTSDLGPDSTSETAAETSKTMEAEAPASSPTPALSAGSRPTAAESQTKPEVSPLNEEDKKPGFLPQLDIDGLDKMVSNELSAHRRIFLDELKALISDDFHLKKPRKKARPAEISVENDIKEAALAAAINKLKAG